VAITAVHYDENQCSPICLIGGKVASTTLGCPGQDCGGRREYPDGSVLVGRPTRFVLRSARRTGVQLFDQTAVRRRLAVVVPSRPDRLGVVYALRNSRDYHQIRGEVLSAARRWL